MRKIWTIFYIFVLVNYCLTCSKEDDNSNNCRDQEILDKMNKVTAEMEKISKEMNAAQAKLTHFLSTFNASMSGALKSLEKNIAELGSEYMQKFFTELQYFKLETQEIKMTLESFRNNVELLNSEMQKTYVTWDIKLDIVLIVVACVGVISLVLVGGKCVKCFRKDPIFNQGGLLNDEQGVINQEPGSSARNTTSKRNNTRRNGDDPEIC